MGKVKPRLLGLEEVEKKQKKEQKEKAAEKKMLKKKEIKKEVEPVKKTSPAKALKVKPKEVKVKSRGKVTVSVSNVAPLDAKFVNLELLDSKYYQVISQKSIYIGDLESDDFDTVEYDIYAKKTKDWKVPLDFLVRYKDAYNNELEYKKTLYLETYSYFGQLKYGIKSPKGIFRFIIFVAIIVFLYYFFRFN